MENEYAGMRSNDHSDSSRVRLPPTRNLSSRTRNREERCSCHDVRMTAPWILRPIRKQDDPAIAAIIHEVMTEHDCGSDGFAIHDAEVAQMSEHYRGGEACYYVAANSGIVQGGAGFARLHGTTSEQSVCELRKMYYLPVCRGLGLGRALLELLLDEMRLAGYRRCYLETSSRMDRAQSLYRQQGFEEQPNPEGETGHHGCDKFFSRDL